MREVREHGVEIDECRNCGGTFFDAGELQTYVNYVLQRAGSHHNIPVPQRDRYPHYAQSHGYNPHSGHGRRHSSHSGGFFDFSF